MGQIQYSEKYDEFTSTCALVSASFSLRVHHHVSSKYPPKGTSFGLKAGQTTQVGDLMKLSSKQFISTIWDSLNVPFTNGEDSKILIRLGGNMVVLGCRAASSTQPTPQSPDDMNSDPLPNPSQRILTPLSARGKGRPPSKRKQSKSEQVIKRRKKKITSCKDNTEEEGTQKSIESDAICHINGPPPCRSDNIVATQESNVVVEHSHLTQGVQICMPANQYPIFPHTNENMALLLGLSQGSHPNPLYKESEIGNISYPTMHGNYVQGQQYPYWNGGYSMYNMHSSTSRGNDDQELN